MPLFVDSLYVWPVFIAAILIDVLIGEYPSAAHPVVWMGSFIRKGLAVSDRCVSKISRFFSGAAVVVSGIILFGIAASFVSIWFANAEPGTAGFIISGIIVIFFVKSSFSLSALLKAADQVYNALKEGNLKDARRLTAMHLVSRDTVSLNENEIAAAVIESVSENFTDSVVSPWFYLFLGGPAGAVAYRFVNTCDSMMGYRSEKYEWLGKFAARLDDVLNFIPSRLAGGLLCLAAAIIKRFSGKAAFRIMICEHKVTESPTAGWTMSAAAGALGVKLVKHDHYTIEGGKMLPQIEDIPESIVLVRTAMIFTVVFGALLSLLVSGVLV